MTGEPVGRPSGEFLWREPVGCGAGLAAPCIAHEAPPFAGFFFELIQKPFVGLLVLMCQHLAFFLILGRLRLYLRLYFPGLCGLVSRRLCPYAAMSLCRAREGRLMAFVVRASCMEEGRWRGALIASGRPSSKVSYNAAALQAAGPRSRERAVT
jgi:hypothetical protein